MPPRKGGKGRNRDEKENVEEKYKEEKKSVKKEHKNVNRKMLASESNVPFTCLPTVVSGKLDMGYKGYHH